MLLYQKIVGFAIFLVMLIIVSICTYYFWPKSVIVKTDLSTNADNEKNTGRIEGSATNSQNNNQSHYSFGGEFIFTILIFLLLLMQSAFQTFIFLRYINKTTGPKKAKAHPTTLDSSCPPSPKLTNQQNWQRAKSLPHSPEIQPTSFQNVPNSYYTISELDSPKRPPVYGLSPLPTTPRSPYGKLQRHVSELDLKENQIEAEPDYKKLNNNLKLRSSAAGLTF